MIYMLNSNLHVEMIRNEYTFKAIFWCFECKDLLE